MRKTPNVVSGIGALSAAESPSASTRRVLALGLPAALHAQIPATTSGNSRM